MNCSKETQYNSSTLPTLSPLSTSPQITTADQRCSAALVMTSQPVAATAVAAGTYLLSEPFFWLEKDKQDYWLGPRWGAACGCGGDVMQTG